MVSNREELKLNARLFQNQVLSIEDLQYNSYSAIRLMSTSTPAIDFWESSRLPPFSKLALDFDDASPCLLS